MSIKIVAVLTFNTDFIYYIIFKIKILSLIKSTLKSRSFRYGIRLFSKIMLLGKINLIVFIN